MGSVPILVHRKSYLIGLKLIYAYHFVVFFTQGIKRKINAYEVAMNVRKLEKLIKTQNSNFLMFGSI